MTDATISRVRMRELVRRGRSRPEDCAADGTVHWAGASRRESDPKASSLAAALPSRPRAASSRPGDGELVASAIAGYRSNVFTGIVRDVGRVVSFDGSRLVVETSVEGAVGDSIAIDGICLTVVASRSPGARPESARADSGRAKTRGHQLTFDVVPETLGRVKPFGAEVNVEPPLRAGDPLGGHYVQGHVDAVGRVTSVEAEGDGLRVFVDAPHQVLRYCVEKGSIAVDGVSLTVAEVADGGFAIALVPHTLASTTFSTLVPGRAVNLEVDVLAKYVERLLQPRVE